MRAIDGDRLKRKAQKVATEAWKMKIRANVEVVLNQFIDWINEAPTIEPEPHWIPCEDRLPEQEQRVLINLSDGDTSVGWLLRGNIWFTDYSYGKPEDEVIAWMPLPEPYAERRTDVDANT